MIKTKMIDSIRDIDSSLDKIRRRPYGMIEAINGKFIRIQLRPWPKIASLLEAHWLQGMKSKRQQKDVCRLYYNQPLAHRNYLTLSYIESSFHTSIRTLYATIDVLDRIAFIKRSDALMAEVTNQKISDRFLQRRGWERHLEHKRKRHWIKRFYGEYPDTVKTTSNRIRSGDGRLATTVVPVAPGVDDGGARSLR